MKTEKNRLLNETDNGYVLECHCCHEIQIAFGNLILKNSREHFASFRQSLEEVAIDPLTHKKFVIQLAEGIAACLAKEELIELRELLEGAAISLSIQQLIQEA